MWRLASLAVIAEERVIPAVDQLFGRDLLTFLVFHFKVPFKILRNSANGGLQSRCESTR